MKVYQAINAVQGELAKSGISKDSTNTFDNYKFRGIDSVYNALSPLLAKHGLCILPRMLSRTVDERQSQKGGALFYVTVDAEFDFVSAEDGSKHTVKTFGEAMDRGDKATNKAMSAAYKYAAFQAFAIPTEGDNDADASTHAVAESPPRFIDKQPNFPKVADLVLEDSEALPDEDKRRIEQLADDIKAQFPKVGPVTCDQRIALEDLDYIGEIYLSTLLPAPMRNAIKVAKQKRNQQKVAA